MNCWKLKASFVSKKYYKKDTPLKYFRLFFGVSMSLYVSMFRQNSNLKYYAFLVQNALLFIHKKCHFIAQYKGKQPDISNSINNTKICLSLRSNRCNATPKLFHGTSVYSFISSTLHRVTLDCAEQSKEETESVVPLQVDCLTYSQSQLSAAAFRRVLIKSSIASGKETLRCDHPQGFFVGLNHTAPRLLLIAFERSSHHRRAYREAI